MVILQRDPARRRRIKLTPLRILIVLALLVIGIGGGGLQAAQGLGALARPLSGAGHHGFGGDRRGQLDSRAKRRHRLRLSGRFLRATRRAIRPSPANLEGVKAIGLRHGPIHRYSLCAGATAQATAFIATVPRDAAMLPPVVAFAFSPLCPARPSRDKLLAELNIFLNQIEAHGGKPAILRLSRDVEAAYDLSSGINRTLWLEGDFLPPGYPPGYATRPWVMWTASTWRRVPGIKSAVEWDVVRP